MGQDRSETERLAPALGDRGLFPELEIAAYLNHAAISPPSLPVLRAIETSVLRIARRGTDGFLPGLQQRERLRGKLATLLAGRSEEIALLPSTSSAVISVAMCFPWQRGDRVLSFQGEFPTNVTPWQRAAELHDLRFELLAPPEPRDPAACLDPLERELQAGARLVAVSAVQFQTGLRMPLAEIGRLCRRYGAAFFVDAIQACGVVPLDVEALQIDFLACGSHKWLMGIEGAAFLYARNEPNLALVPHLASWLSHDDPVRFLMDGPGHLRYDRPFRAGPTMLENGTCNASAYAALEASLDLLLALGVPAIYEHVQRYHDLLEPLLLARGYSSARSGDLAARSGILSFRPPAGIDVRSLPGLLLPRGVCASIPDGWLRFSPHWPNAVGELTAVAEALDAVGNQ